MVGHVPFGVTGVQEMLPCTETWPQLVSPRGAFPHGQEVQRSRWPPRPVTACSPPEKPQGAGAAAPRTQCIARRAIPQKAATWLWRPASLRGSVRLTRSMGEPEAEEGEGRGLWWSDPGQIFFPNIHFCWLSFVCKCVGVLLEKQLMCCYEQGASYTILTVTDNLQTYTGSLSSLWVAEKYIKDAS